MQIAHMTISLYKKAVSCCSLLLFLWLFGLLWLVSAQEVEADDISLGVSRQTVELRNSVVLMADFIRMTRSENGQTMEARGNVELKAGGMVLRSRFLEYSSADNILKASGDVVLNVAPYGDLLTDKVIFDLEENRLLATVVRGLFFDKHKIAVQNFEIDADGKNVNVLGGTYTVCPVCTEADKEAGTVSIFKPIWRLRFGQILEEDDGDSIFLRNVSFEVLGINLPILFFPEFAVLSPKVERQSGLLFLKGGVGASGLTIGLPFFVALGEDTNLLLTPYLGSDYSMIGMEAEKIYERGQAEFAMLYKPETGLRKGISDDQIARMGLRSRFHWDVNENTRVKNEIDFVSDADYVSSYKGFYKRYMPDRAPSKWRLDLVQFSEKNFTQLSSGMSSNTYGKSPLNTQYIESRSRYNIVIEGQKLEAILDVLTMKETYNPDNQEVSDVSFRYDDSLTMPNSTQSALRFGVEQKARKIFSNGLVLDGKTGIYTFYREAKGNLYRGIKSYDNNGFARAGFSAVDESRTAVDIKNYLKVSLPFVRYQDSERSLFSPFVAFAFSWRLLGEEVNNLREEWFFPNRLSLIGEEQTPYTSDVDQGTRLLVGFDGKESIIGESDLSFYGGYSYKLFGGDQSIKSPHTLSQPMLFGGGKFLLGPGKIIQYKAILDATTNDMVASYWGLDMAFNNGITLGSSYVSVRKDTELYKDKLDLLGLSVDIKLRRDLMLKSSFKQDISDLEDYMYSLGLRYEIPCFEIGFTWYNDRITDRFAADGVKKDSGVQLSFNIFSATADQVNQTLLD